MGRLLGSLVALAALVACGQPGPYAIHRLLESEEGGYRLRYLAPPWELVEADGSDALLRIPSNAARYAGVDAAVLPKYELQISVVLGDPRSLAERDARRAPSRGERVSVVTRELVTLHGDEGFEVVTESAEPPTRYRRYSYLTHPRGALRLYFEGTPDLASAEVDAMVASVEVQP